MADSVFCPHLNKMKLDSALRPDGLRGFPILHVTHLLGWQSCSPSLALGSLTAGDISLSLKHTEERQKHVTWTSLVFFPGICPDFQQTPWERSLELMLRTSKKPQCFLHCFLDFLTAFLFFFFFFFKKLRSLGEDYRAIYAHSRFFFVLF